MRVGKWRIGACNAGGSPWINQSLFLFIESTPENLCLYDRSLYPVYGLATSVLMPAFVCGYRIQLLNRDQRYIDSIPYLLKLFRLLWLLCHCYRMLVLEP